MRKAALLWPSRTPALHPLLKILGWYHLVVFVFIAFACFYFTHFVVLGLVILFLLKSAESEVKDRYG